MDVERAMRTTMPPVVLEHDSNRSADKQSDASVMRATTIRLENMPAATSASPMCAHARTTAVSHRYTNAKMFTNKNDNDINLFHEKTQINAIYAPSKHTEIETMATVFQ
jgi:hypothetical protein